MEDVATRDLLIRLTAMERENKRLIYGLMENIRPRNTAEGGYVEDGDQLSDSKGGDGEEKTVRRKKSRSDPRSDARYKSDERWRLNDPRNGRW